MKDTLYLSWLYLARHRVKTVILVCSLSLIIFLPVGLKVMVDQTSTSLTSRAEATPLVIGAKGSPLELVLNTLYFASDVPSPMEYGEVARLADAGQAMPIPIHARFRVEGQPVIGTHLDYFDYRGLRIAAGRQMALLGECVLGAGAAQELGVAPGGSVMSAPENVFDIAGVYPLKMHVVGVLAAAGTPDDAGVFVDVRTAWVISGLAHGHQDLLEPEAAAQVLERREDVVIGNAAVVQYNEITPDNVDSFHFHGDVATFPITAVIAIPHDAKSAALLQGQYLDDARVQVIKPVVIMDELLATVVSVRQHVVMGMLIVGAATLLTTVLVFLLSLRLRQRELATLHRIGGSRTRIASILVVEVVLTIVMAGALATVLTVATARFGMVAIQSLVVGQP